MAFLLGGESCIDSLRCDLTDIQETIDDIVSRIGYVKCYSWKYPDKIATDIKIDELLDRYKYGKDEVDNQVAHYSLLEIIIDRLILLVHLSGLQIEKILSPGDTSRPATAKPPNGQTVTTNLGAGLTIKKFWSKFTHLCTTTRQLHCQNKTLSQKQIKDFPTDRSVAKSSKNAEAISSEISNKSTQTVETAFVPCESCAKVQNHLKQNADIILNMCHYQNIPSYLAKFRSSLTNQTISWLNAADIERWLLEQDKDLTKISKQLEYLSKNSELLKDKLEESENNLTKLANTEKDLKKALKEEQDIRSTTMKQYEKKLTDQKNENNAHIKQMQDEFDNLKEIKDNLETQISHLENINKENERIIQELNETNGILAKENDVKMNEKERITKLEQDKALLNVELECLKREVNEKNKELSKERSKIENMIRHEQSLQMKQETLLKSMEQLSEECEGLKSHLNSIEEDKDSFETEHRDLLDRLDAQDEEIKRYQVENKSLNKSMTELKTNINSLTDEVKKLKEKELLLMQYPDLYGPMPIQKDTDIIKDMELQIQANKYRIDLLEQQNQTLKSSMQRLLEKERSTPFSHYNSNPPVNEFVHVTRPTPLFKLENEITEPVSKPPHQYSPIQQQNHYVNNNFYQNETIADQDSVFIKVERNGNVTPSVHTYNEYNSVTNLLNNKKDDDYRIQSAKYDSSRRNSISGSARNYRNVTPITPPVKDMEILIGKGHQRPNSASRPPSSIGKNQQTSSSPSNRLNSTRNDSKNKFSCEKCSKNYNNKKDLDIHKLYCNK